MSNTKVSAEKKEAFLRALNEGWSTRMAARRAGRSSTGCFYDARKRDPAFARAWEKAAAGYWADLNLGKVFISPEGRFVPNPEYEMRAEARRLAKLGAIALAVEKYKATKARGAVKEVALNGCILTRASTSGRGGRCKMFEACPHYNGGEGTCLHYVSHKLDWPGWKARKVLPSQESAA